MPKDPRETEQVNEERQDGKGQYYMCSMIASAESRSTMSKLPFVVRVEAKSLAFTKQQLGVVSYTGPTLVLVSGFMPSSASTRPTQSSAMRLYLNQRRVLVYITNDSSVLVVEISTGERVTYPFDVLMPVHFQTATGSGDLSGC